MLIPVEALQTSDIKTSFPEICTNVLRFSIELTAVTDYLYFSRGIKTEDLYGARSTYIFQIIRSRSSKLRYYQPYDIIRTDQLIIYVINRRDTTVLAVFFMSIFFSSFQEFVLYIRQRNESCLNLFYTIFVQISFEIQYNLMNNLSH
jgi:hypothetical protein